MQVRRNELTPIKSKVVHRKTEGFGKFLWELCLDDIDQRIKSFKRLENPPHPNFIKGLSLGLRSVRFGSVIDKTETETNFQFGNWYLPKPIGFSFIDYRNR